MSQKIAIVDCNNFYVSCERLFRPNLWNKPVAVLSNNDGCIVSRSQEVKDLGIKMAVPIHQVKDLVRQHNIELFSSNYPLYADLSARVMESLADFSPSVDVYSIDEAFVDLNQQNITAVEIGLEIKSKIWQWIGIPVGVGIGPTKTLAKLANYAAKKWPKTGGVVDISEPLKRKKIMQITPVNEVWGVGRRLNEKLNLLGIESVWDLQSQSIAAIKKNFNITLAQTVQELKGMPVIELADPNLPKQQIICSRSFKKKLDNQQELAQCLSVFCLRVAEKLRYQKGYTAKVTIQIRTSPFEKDKTFYSNSAQQKLTIATNDSRILLAVTKQLLAAIYKPGFLYQKATIILGDIQSFSIDEQQADLFLAPLIKPKNELMETLDKINQRFSKSISFGATGNKTLRQSIPINESEHYTTDWEGLANVRIQ